MRAVDLRDDAGILTGFEVSNVLLSRRRACRIASAVLGASVHRRPLRWAWSDDEFCRFDVDGTPFLIVEPFGDSDRYCVVAEIPSVDNAALIGRVKASFVAAWGWPLSRRR
ncbi:MAG TPA: hypothetical protein VJR92_01150 [Gemmatimonadaceae bacterium]|nr:hypothetical protein [Gemmatimonadaceae bacterium]